MPERWLGDGLPVFAAALVLWLMLASIMGASAYYYDSEQSPVSFSAFTSNRWTQTTRADFFIDGRVAVDIDRRPGDVVLSGRTEFLYAFQGGNSRNFLRYNTSANTWNNMANAPSPLRDEGGALASDGDRYIFAIQGGNRQFWRYDTVANSWANMARTPEAVRLGGGLAFDGKNYLYALQGSTANGFWRYNISTDSWSILTNAPGRVSDGGCLVHDQGNFAYALQGNGRTAFWRYNVTSNTWSTMASTPYPVRYGGAITYDGVDSIYAVPGLSQTYFLRYSISENRWYILSNVPAPVGLGGSVSFSYPGKVLVLSGASTNYLWRYDIATSTWSSGANSPGPIGSGGALANGAMLNSKLGTLTSVVFDALNDSTSIKGFFWDEIVRPGTDITFEVRASNTLSSGVPDSPWVNIGGTSPIMYGLPSGRYIQWRATLTTTNPHLTPVLQEVRVYYV